MSIWDSSWAELGRPRANKAKRRRLTLALVGESSREEKKSRERLWNIEY